MYMGKVKTVQKKYVKDVVNHAFDRQPPVLCSWPYLTPRKPLLPLLFVIFQIVRVYECMQYSQILLTTLLILSCTVFFLLISCLYISGHTDILFFLTSA